MINIVRGQTKAIKFILRGQVSGKPVDLTGATELLVELPNQDPATSPLVKKLSLAEVSTGTDPKLGEVSLAADLTTDETTALNADNTPQKLKAVVTKGSDVKIYGSEILLITDL